MLTKDEMKKAIIHDIKLNKLTNAQLEMVVGTIAKFIESNEIKECHCNVLDDDY